MDPREITAGDWLEVLQLAFERGASKLWTALPAQVVEDSEGHICTVQPTIKGRHIKEDGSIEHLEMPKLGHTPIHFASGGGFTITHPIKQGDEGIVLFAARNIDNWWAKGGLQTQPYLRKHHLSDSFYIPGIRSNPRKLGGGNGTLRTAKPASTNSIQMRSDDGEWFYELAAEGAVNVMAKNAVVKAIEALTHDSPSTTATGDHTIEKNALVKLSQTVEKNLSVSKLANLGSAMVGGLPFTLLAHQQASPSFRADDPDPEPPPGLIIGNPIPPMGGMVIGDVNAKRLMVDGVPAAIGIGDPVAVVHGGTWATNFPLRRGPNPGGVIPFAQGQAPFYASDWGPYAGYPDSLLAYSAQGPWITLGRSGGDNLTPTATPPGYMGGLYIDGYDGAGWVSNKAFIEFNSMETWTASARGTMIMFATTAPGSDATASALIVTSGGINVAGFVTARGITTRAGTSAPPGSNLFNIQWTGSVANLWIDDFNYGGLISSAGGSTITGDLTTSAKLIFSSGALGSPTFGTRSPGTRIVFWNGLSGTAVDYAMGMDSGTLWYSVPVASPGSSHKWFGGQTNIATLDGGGNLSVTNSVNTSVVNAVARLVTGNSSTFQGNPVQATTPTGSDCWVATAVNNVRTWFTGVQGGGAYWVYDASAGARRFAIDTGGQVFIDRETLYVGWSITTEGARVELGQNRAADGWAYIDFHSTPGSDYNLRIAHQPGAGGTAQLTKIGPGAFEIYNDSGRLWLGHNSHASDPVEIRTGTGQYCRIVYNIWGIRVWSAGALTDGGFGIADESVGAMRTVWDTNGRINHYGYLSAGDFASQGNVYVPNGWVSASQQITAGSGIYANGVYPGTGFGLIAQAPMECRSDLWVRGNTIHDQNWLLMRRGGRDWYLSNDGNSLIFSVNPGDGGAFMFWLDWSNGAIQCNRNTNVSGAFTVSGYSTHGDFRSNGNLYCPNGYVYAPGGTSTLGTLQVNGNIGLGGWAYKAGSSDNWRTYADGGYHARVQYAVGGSRTWAAGVKNDGNFYIADLTAGIDRIWWRYDGHTAPAQDNTYWNGYGGYSWFGMASYNYANASDPALKKDITSAPHGALDKVLALRAIDFRWKAGPDITKLHRGFSAPEVREVMGAYSGAYVEFEGHQMICHNELVGVLWKAVQELSAKNDALEARLAPLEAR